jgi:hypothetical protein
VVADGKEVAIKYLNAAYRDIEINMCLKKKVEKRDHKD